MKNQNGQFDVYAAFYDLLYNDKNYKGEADFIDDLILEFCSKRRNDISLLDLACGTGKHLFELSAKGYKSLAGSDISGSMIDVAEENAKLNGHKINFYKYSFQEASRIEIKFDVIISMFSAMNYLTSFKDQSMTLTNIHSLLKEGGIFIFDFWNGCAVTQNYSPVRVLRKKHGEKEILRLSETSLNLIDQTATVKFSCNYFLGNNRISEFDEIHKLHYYYFSEMQNLLASHKFEILHICPFMEAQRKVMAHDWNVSIVARKIG